MNELGRRWVWVWLQNASGAGTDGPWQDESAWWLLTEIPGRPFSLEDGDPVPSWAHGILERDIKLPVLVNQTGERPTEPPAGWTRPEGWLPRT